MNSSLSVLAATGAELSEGQLDEAAGGVLPILVFWGVGLAVGYALAQ